MTTDELLGEALEAQAAVDEANREFQVAVQRRDAAVTRARMTGVVSVDELGRLLGVSRTVIYRILERSGLDH